jgi:hypothetical protein
MTFLALASWTYISIAHYGHNEFTKIVAFTILFILFGHVIVGIVRGLFWTLQTLIVMDMENKLNRDYDAKAN